MDRRANGPALEGLCFVCDGSSAEELNRLGGVDVCDRCLEGGVGTVATRRGWQMTTKTRNVSRGSQHWHQQQTTFAFTFEPAFEATFAAKEGWRRVAALFARCEIDDPLFNRSVYCRTSSQDVVRRFLADEGVQSVVMGLVGKPGTVEVRVRQLRVEVVIENGTNLEVAVEAEAAILLRHLERFSLCHATDTPAVK